MAQTRTEGGKLLPYVLHPSVLDAALHASIGLLLDQGDQLVLRVPVALSELSIEGSLPTQGWAWVRWSSGSATSAASGLALLVDIEVCDDAGYVAVRLRKELPRVIEQELEMHNKTFHQEEVKERIISLFGTN